MRTVWEPRDPYTPTEMWQLFPMLEAAYNDWAPDYFSQMLACLDNYISRDPATFCRGAHNGVRYPQMVSLAPSYLLPPPRPSFPSLLCSRRGGR